MNKSDVDNVDNQVKLPTNGRDEKPTLVALDSPEGITRLKEFVRELYTLNHDLNNPLAGVIGYTELATSEPDILPTHIVDYLGKVQLSAAKLEAVIARASQAKYSLQEHVDVTELQPDD
ncbi:hypothetical protein JYU03_00465 [bacterium AH-315-F03]|nr:hypothetical protein [bacterium AH-315-F03]